MNIDRAVREYGSVTAYVNHEIATLESEHGESIIRDIGSLNSEVYDFADGCSVRVLVSHGYISIVSFGFISLRAVE